MLLLLGTLLLVPALLLQLIIKGTCSWMQRLARENILQPMSPLKSKVGVMRSKDCLRLQIPIFMRPMLHSHMDCLVAGHIPYKTKYWRGVNFVDFWIKSPIFNPSIIFLQRYMYAFM